MYVYLEPKGGFNDILVNINLAIIFCKQNNRTLLLNTIKTHYKINFKEYFYFKEVDVNIISDIDIIKNIISDTQLSIYPNIFETREIDNWKFYFNRDKLRFLEKKSNTLMILPDKDVNDDIVVFIDCSRSHYNNLNTILLFNNLYFNKNIIDYRRVLNLSTL